MEAADTVPADKIEMVARDLHAKGSLGWMRWDQLDPRVVLELREKAKRLELFGSTTTDAVSR